MSVDDSDAIDDRRLADLLAFGETLAEGRSGLRSTYDDTQGLDDSLATLRNCVRLLDQVLPTQRGERVSPAVDSVSPPERISRFEILGEIGRGGFGVVLRAYDPALKRQVALKVPRPEFLANPDAKQRFLREGCASSRLEHPNIVQVFEAGEVGPIGYIASALCHGPSLATWLSDRAEPVPPAVAARIVAALAGAIDHAHRRDVLHRDLKPSNILLHTNELDSQSESSTDALPFIPRLCDFGLAKLLDQSVDQTPTGAMVGTPPYMAPEQVDGRPNGIGPATDLYSLGVILYELLTGRPPFRGETSLETLRLIVQEEPPPLRSFRPGLARDLETIALKCLEKQPGRRYPSAAALVDDLERYLNGRPIKARPTGVLRRSLKWARRYPSRASILAVCMLTGVVVTSALVIGQWWQARQNARLREVNTRLESTLARAEQSERDARRRLFGSMVRQAQVALDGGHDELAFDLLQSASRQDMGAGAPGFAWSHLNRRIGDRLRIFEGPSRPIGTLEVSPDGRTLASFESEGRLSFWNLSDGSVRRVHDGPFKNIRDVIFSRDSRTLAVLHHDEKQPYLNLFDVGSGRCWPTDPSRRDHLHNVLFSRDGRTLAGVTEVQFAELHRIVFWDLSRGPSGTISPLEDHEGLVRMGMEHDDPTLRVVADVLDGKLIDPQQVGEETSPPATGYVLTKDRQFAVIGRGGPAIQVRHHTGALLASGIPLGKASAMLMTAPESLDKTVTADWFPRVEHIRRLAPAERQARVFLKLDREVVPHRFDNTGDRLAKQEMNAEPHLIDLKTGADQLVDMRGQLTSLAFSPDGRALHMGGDDGRIRMRTISPADEQLTFQAHFKEIWGITWSPDGKSLATSSDDGTVKLWDLVSKGLPLERKVLKGHGALVTSVAWSPDGKSLASSGYKPRDVRVWDATTGACKAVLSGHTGIVRMVAWSPDGQTLASCGDDRTVRLWDPYRLGFIHRAPLQSQGHGFLAVAWSPDSKTLASAGLDGRVVLWDVVAGKEIRSWDLGTQVFAVAYAPGGQSLAAALIDGSIRIWDPSASSLEGALILRGHARWAQTLAFSPDGRILASGGMDQSVRLWDPSTGQELAALLGHTARVNRIAFSRDCGTLASCDHDGIVRLWQSAPR